MWHHLCHHYRFFPETIDENRNLQAADESHMKPNKNHSFDVTKEIISIRGKMHRKLHTFRHHMQNSVRGIAGKEIEFLISYI